MKLMINKSNYLIFMFYPILITSIIMNLSSSSWLMTWMLIELNLLSFIPIMLNQTKLKNNSIMMKYYVIQTFSSIIMLFSLSFSMIIFINQLKTLMFWSMMMKLGLPPFHNWFINIMKKNSWLICAIISTIQKVIPILILSFFMFSNNLMIIILILLMFFLLINMSKFFNSSSMKLIMSYSSIINSFWIIITSLFNKFIMILFMSIYFLSTWFIMYIFKMMKIKLLNNLMNSQLSKWMYMILMMSMIISAIPPSLMFTMKLMMIYLNLLNKYILLILIIISSISVIIYFRLFFKIMLMKNFLNKINMFTKIIQNQYFKKKIMMNSMIFMMISINMFLLFSSLTYLLN
uniref:NADH-ubiquinone oxidoreductase chain 2 n=1 Tax=Dendrocerus sp. ZJUH_2016009 TaxID=2491154 RepID=A0A3Q8U9Y4_9HYME|nr:NADH dehydrogenase subunit 2 [Dendrocerus sp. ZJUH_2016009]